MHKLPIDFKSQALATGHFEDSWSINSGPQKAKCAIPSEFGGNGAGFSPEDLFLQALINCFIGTFKVYAKASKVGFSNLSLKGILTVDQGPEKKIWMKSVLLEIQIDGVDRPDRIETIVSKTIKDGFILNSVKSEISYKLEVNPNA